MVSSAPRISFRLIEALVRLDDKTLPIADTYRGVGEEAERLRLTRPSYQRIRQLVHESRRVRRKPSTARIMLEVAVRSRSPEELLDHVSGVGVRPLRS